MHDVQKPGELLVRAGVKLRDLPVDSVGEPDLRGLPHELADERVLSDAVAAGRGELRQAPSRNWPAPAAHAAVVRGHARRQRGRKRLHCARGDGQRGGLGGGWCRADCELLLTDNAPGVSGKEAFAGTTRADDGHFACADAPACPST